MEWGGQVGRWCGVLEEGMLWAVVWVGENEERGGKMRGGGGRGSECWCGSVGVGVWVCGCGRWCLVARHDEWLWCARGLCMCVCV